MLEQIKVSCQDSEAVIRIGGRFDFKLHKAFRDAYEQLAKDSVKKYVIDLKDTVYMDSSALGMLLVLREKVSPQARIDLVNCNKDIRNILDISNFQKLFTVQ